MIKLRVRRCEQLPSVKAVFGRGHRARSCRRPAWVAPAMLRRKHWADNLFRRSCLCLSALVDSLLVRTPKSSSRQLYGHGIPVHLTQRTVTLLRAAIASRPLRRVPPRVFFVPSPPQAMVRLAALCGALLVAVNTAVVGQDAPVFESLFSQTLPLKPGLVIRATVDGEPGLTAPRALVTDSGYVYVLDPAGYGVHRYNRHGDWVETVGRQGQGPGEFLRPADMGWVADTLWVADSRLSRVSFFDGDGVFVRSIRFHVATGQEVWTPRRVMIGPRVLSAPYYASRRTQTVDSLPVLVMNEDGSAADTLGWRHWGQTSVSLNVSGVGALSIGHPFDLRSILAHDPRGRWMYLGTWRTDADDRSYLQIMRISASGDTTFVTNLPFPRVPLAPADVRGYAEHIYSESSDDLRTVVSAQELIHAFLAQVAKPSRTSVDAMLASEDGSVWLRRSDSVTRLTSTEWLLYHPDRGPMGHIELPIGEYALSATSGTLWTVSVDELDLPTIRSWEIDWNGATSPWEEERE